ncbi:MAG: IS110 family transposase [Bacteroidota bacterium]|jgi:transposase|nr:IS110 family transposase [Bacteroidota bacterium]
METKVNKNYFAGQPIYVGIDCHKTSWKVCILGEHYEHKTFSQNPDPELLVKYLKKNFPGGSYHAVYEAGFSGFDSCRKLLELEVDCKVIHPADVPTNQKERLQKTDKIDSRKLARALKNGELKGINIPCLELEADRSLVRQRFRIMKDLTRIKLRVKSLLMQHHINIPEHLAVQSRHWSKVYTTWLKSLTIEQESLKLAIDNYVRYGETIRKELYLVNRQVRTLSQSERYKDNFELLLSVPGIGLTTAMMLLVQIGDINRFKSFDELCSYVGLVPSMYGSGDKMVVGKMVKRGRKMLKIMLIEAAWVSIRTDPVMMAKFAELSRVMKKNKAIIRIAKKVLNRIRYILKNHQAYEIGVVV